VSDDYQHLQPSARVWADEDAVARVRRIRTDRWIAYARAEAALAAIEDVLSFPKRTRMPNLLLVGPTNNGKTMIVEKFRRTHPPTEAQSMADSNALIPVIRVQMPCGPDERRFFGAILDALGMEPWRNDKVAARQDLAVRLMRQTGVQLLVIDELHNVLSGAPIQQLVNRFEPIPLPVWTENDEYLRLLRTLEAVLPLRRPSGLARPALAAKIFALSEGILGEIVAIVTRAAAHAVLTGAEAITSNLIEETGFTRPSDRRRVAI